MIFQALRWAVEGAKTAVVAFLFIEHRPDDPPAPGVQAEKLLAPIGPGALAGKNELVFDCHEYLHLRCCLVINT